MTTPIKRLRVALIPSVSGGLGHVGRLGRLARALEAADDDLEFTFVLPELNLRPINVAAVKSLGYPVRILPNPVRHERDVAVQRVLGDLDAVIEDTERRLLAYRPLLPRLRTWVSVPMLPLWDELFLDWPLLEHADHILYTYPETLPFPAELERFRGKLTVTGPLVEAPSVSRDEARRRLRLSRRVRLITYAPRGFPFGRWFGERVLNGVVGAVIRLRDRYDVRLALTAVPDPAAIQPRRLPPLAQIPAVSVHGMLPPARVATILAAADIVVVEGTSTLFDAALGGVPVIMVPGLIYETFLEGGWVADHDAGLVVRPEEVSRRSMARLIESVLDDPDAAAARAGRLRALVGEGGLDAAVRAVRAAIGRPG